jgi:predicted nucleic acid-binding protein
LILFPDTSAWSLIFRRDTPFPCQEAQALHRAIDNRDRIATTGVVLQEILQGFVGPKSRQSIIERFLVLPFVFPDRADHIEAAGLRNVCRQRGIQVETIDALLAQLCIRHGMTMLTADSDFEHIAKHSELDLWRGES